MRHLFVILFFFNAFSPVFSQVESDTLKVGYTPAAPFIVTSNESMHGINVWLWKQVAKELDLKYKMVPMEFSAMLDSLKAGRIDISINPLTITGERSKHMEFTHSFYASHSTIVVPKSTSFQRLMNFLESFLHINFLRGFLLLIFILLFFGILIWLFERRRNTRDFRSNAKGIWDGFWWSAVTMTTVGYGDKAPKTRMGKIAALGLMLSGLLFVSGLTASIASSLTVDQLSDNTNSFSAFKDQNIGTIKNSSANDFLKVHFFKNIKPYSSVLPGLTDLKNRKINAFIYDEPILQYRIAKDSLLTDLELLPIKFDVQFYAFGIAKDKVHLEQRISQAILEIIETQKWEILLSEYGLNEI
ncbi:Glutamine-binding periplasmic protein [Flagellimonas maritima]|uniref:Glutamine-binding periplasmic protein n=1 Tax=Flagellimonas maritima TaxID=1383885 RepID=A0A2Z4LWX7_9FLAO|nr:transporter substrate-binding domain-containing protein [Allomuricauda aurantiaca]AWX46220.1 Glutamine-binding periplasmic protein [Allomuricauda aurantiaca]